jgi:hypothetical protein
MSDDTPQGTDSEAAVESTKAHVYRLGMVLIGAYEGGRSP